MINFISKFFGVKKDWVLFYDMFSKNNNGDSIKPVAEELRKRNCNLKLIFVVRKRGTKIDIADETVVKGSPKFHYVSRVAKYLISPMAFPNNGYKNKGQKFIQTWHGTPLKKLYLSRDKNNKDDRIYANIFKSADIFCISCNFARSAFKEALDLRDDQFIESGLPRNDILFPRKDTPVLKEKIRCSLGLPPDKKVLFYCPTWRRYDHKAVLPFDIEKLREKFSDEYVLLIRSHVGKHSWIDKNGNEAKIFDNEFSFDGGTYPEATELYLISDALISDYSSAIFDFSITQKPQIMYAYDLENYEKEFGLYLDYERELPFPIAKNTEELVAEIGRLDKFDEKYGKRYANFAKEFCEFEKGDASAKIADYILNES